MQKIDQNEDNEEELSSDEEYYRELEKIKSQGQSAGQFEGGSPSSTNSRNREEGKDQAEKQAKKKNYNTID